MVKSLQALFRKINNTKGKARTTIDSPLHHLIQEPNKSRNPPVVPSLFHKK